MKKYISLLEIEKYNPNKKPVSVTAEISGIQDSIKKLEFQNKQDEIDMKYLDKQDPKYNENLNNVRNRIKGRTESIQTLKDKVQQIKDGNTKK